MFYIENAALRLLFLLAVSLAAVNLGIFIKCTAAGDPFSFDVVKNLGFPVFLAVVSWVFWKPRQK